MTALSSWELCVKYALFIFNFIFWLAGTGVLAVGLWLRFDSRTAGLFEGQDSPTVFFTGVYILIAAGALMIVVGFLGCCGAIKESPCMLGLFFLFLLIIFAVEVAAGIWGLSNKDRVVEDVTEFYKQTYNNYKDTKQEALKETLRLHPLRRTVIMLPKISAPKGRTEAPSPRRKSYLSFLCSSCSQELSVSIDEMFNTQAAHHRVGLYQYWVIMIFGMIFA
ncbi:CD9 antigen-like isoform X1 [Lates japonicus]|uniref:CD9 antigen-like isoform X1 n=1 Tax=Lates japonicus TaxID=270547 RepID=A0AAD3M6D0_LATJO|nr:CD9 antigen-like isoform X1 [Lates japonicus]